MISLASLPLPKCSGDLEYCPCPPSCYWSSRVFDLVHWSSSLTLRLYLIQKALSFANTKPCVGGLHETISGNRDFFRSICECPNILESLDLEFGASLSWKMVGTWHRTLEIGSANRPLSIQRMLLEKKVPDKYLNQVFHLLNANMPTINYLLYRKH